MLQTFRDGIIGITGRKFRSERKYMDLHGANDITRNILRRVMKFVHAVQQQKEH